MSVMDIVYVRYRHMSTRQCSVGLFQAWGEKCRLRVYVGDHFDTAHPDLVSMMIPVLRSQGIDGLLVSMKRPHRDGQSSPVPFFIRALS
jgi:hypothetical protein